jgi:hypothetical protein
MTTTNTTPSPDQDFKYWVLVVLTCWGGLIWWTLQAKPSDYSECREMCAPNMVAFFKGGVAHEYEASVPVQCQCDISQVRDGGTSPDESAPSVAQGTAQTDAGTAATMKRSQQTTAQAVAKAKARADGGFPASAVGATIP